MKTPKTNSGKVAATFYSGKQAATTWLEFAALPLFAGFALGLGFILGGDDTRKMLETFSPHELTAALPTPEPINKKDLGSHP